MNVWLSFWSSDRFGWTVWEYINVYVATAVIQLLIVMLGSYMLVLAILKGSRVIHDNAFLSVLRSPMSFFDTTPAGRILNRYACLILPAVFLDVLHASNANAIGVFFLL